MISIAEILNQWQAMGVFDYILPFLLIFAIVYGVLQSTKLVSNNKGVHIVIAVVIGLMALRLGFIQEFFAEIFPRLGVGLAVVLALLIMTGLFINNKEAKYWMYGIATVAVIIWLIILIGTFENVGWWFGTYGFMEDYAAMIIGAVLLIGVIITIVVGKSESKGDGTFDGLVIQRGKKE